ncbi:MAG TPA: hypothetical protein VG759_20475 [Candidatus Angelobacter sp.]|jgi:hypothetical protein|nr:hypothetical protein [Candidatus Angelobacter sp.]
MHELRNSFGGRDPQSEKPCRRFPRHRKPMMDFAEAVAYCEDQDDLIGALCFVLGQKPSYMAIQSAWPWLEARVKAPCRCPILHPSVLVTLCHLFDHHVTDLKNWSFSRLMEWTLNVQRRIAPPTPQSEDRKLKHRSKTLMDFNDGCLPGSHSNGRARGRSCRCPCHSKTRPPRKTPRAKAKKMKRTR